MNVFRFVLKIATITTILLLFIPEQVHARIVWMPSYKEMLAKSDLVVIANPMSKTTDTKEESFRVSGNKRRMGNNTGLGRLASKLYSPYLPSSKEMQR